MRSSHMNFFHYSTSNSSEISKKKIDQQYEIRKIINCIWHSISVDAMIDMLNTCAYLHAIHRHHPLSTLITSTFVVPADIYVIPPGLTDDERIKIFCYALGNFYSSTKDFENSLAYYDKALALGPIHIDALVNDRNPRRLRRDEEATRCFDRALEIDFMNTAAMTNKAMQLIRLENFEDAVDY